LIDKNCNDNKECLYQLYQILIEPIEQFLNADEKIVFIPQGNIYKVPFNALMNANGRYLIEDYNISISPSILVSKLLDDKINNKPVFIKNVLVVGNPRMPQLQRSYYSLPMTPPPLKGTEREAEEIANLYRVKPLIGKEATERMIRKNMPFANIIHIATHGYEQTVTGSVEGVLHPSIVVAPSSNDVTEINVHPLASKEVKNDGLLTNDGSLGNQNLTAELAILSACETGLGITVSEGVLGFANNFIYFGVPSVIVSQWQVPDQSTSELMIDFHKYLISGYDKSQALRQAILKTKKNNPDPIDWAGFILVGASRTNINFSSN
jgi:CHAT domain-containing protein